MKKKIIIVLSVLLLVFLGLFVFRNTEPKVVNAITNKPENYTNELQKKVFEYVEQNEFSTISPYNDTDCYMVFSLYDDTGKPFNFLNMENSFTEIIVDSTNNGEKNNVISSSQCSWSYIDDAKSVTKEQISTDIKKVEETLNLQSGIKYQYVSIENDADVDDGGEDDIPEPIYNNFSDITEEDWNNFYTTDTYIAFFYYLENGDRYVVSFSDKQDMQSAWFYAVTISVNYN